MRFNELDTGRIIRAITIIFFISLIMSLMASCFLMFVLIGGDSEFATRFAEFQQLIEENPDAPAEVVQDHINRLQEALVNTLSNPNAEVNVHYIVQWALSALITFYIAQRTARTASTPQQAMGYGLAIGIGTALSYGVLCVMCSPTTIVLRMVFFALLLGAGYSAGQVASQNLSPQTGAGPTMLRPGAPPRRSQDPSLPTGRRSTPTARPASPPRDPQIDYNMGVQAALDGRKAEARDHFTRVLQYQPRNVQAWLQLANLADTPDQAWTYVSQARSIAPDDPQVRDAVAIIWPQVEAQGKHQPPADARSSTGDRTDQDEVPPFDPDAQDDSPDAPSSPDDTDQPGA